MRDSLTIIIAAVTSIVFGLSNACASEASDLYDAHCSACHNLGVAGAPKIADPDAWNPRVAQGNKVLYDHAINGFTGENGSMPPKGGFVELSDEQIKTIVEYMVSRVN
ncbi:MAG: c-type cytochrome [Acidiferrobacterales bacterium]|nr:c-type cytochrome [Acidiferrobacterales bacterium]